MPPKLPVLKPKQVIAALLRAGLYVHHQKGSHARLLHPTRPAALRRIEIHSEGYKAGAMALIEDIRRKRDARTSAARI